MSPVRVPRPRHALVSGKFYPPHAGHVHLASTAATFSDHVTVAVLGASHESLALEDRVAWLREALVRHPNVRVAGVVDDLPVDYADPVAWEGHVALMRRAVELADADGPRPKVDAVFSSERYGHELGRRFEALPVVLDPARTTCPVSGTAVRGDVPGQWDLLPAATQAGLAVRVVVVGAESTGTTTLARDLAAALRVREGSWQRCRWVPEHGRDRCAAMMALAHAAGMPEDLDWSEEDFLAIATEQTRLEHEAARLGGPVLAMDTDALATVVWHERYRGATSPALDAIVASLPRRDLYILTLPDGVPFVQDGLRDGQHLRESMTERFRRILADRAAAPVLELRGSPEDRLRAALGKIDEICRQRWDFAAPLPEANKP
jgi:NadR type nicotinamide-nucleotide adenylyltransferase